MICSSVIALVQPYKKAYMNIIDTLILLDIAMIAVVTDKIIEQEESNAFTTLYFPTASILSSLPLIGIIGFFVYKIFRKLVKRFTFHRRTSHTGREIEGRNIEGVEQENLGSEWHELPHRILHPQEYEKTRIKIEVKVE